MVRLTRDRMVEAIQELPADAAVDDAIERLVLVAKIETGLVQLDRGEGIPHDDVRRRFGLGPNSSGRRKPSLSAVEIVTVFRGSREFPDLQP